jgi:hypothetical protein
MLIFRIIQILVIKLIKFLSKKKVAEKTGQSKTGSSVVDPMKLEVEGWSNFFLKSTSYFC